MKGMLKAIQTVWGFLAFKALADVVSSLILPSIDPPLATVILQFIDSWKISKLLGLSGNTCYIDLFIAILGISIAFLAKRLEEEEL